MTCCFQLFGITRLFFFFFFGSHVVFSMKNRPRAHTQPSALLLLSCCWCHNTLHAWLAGSSSLTISFLKNPSSSMFLKYHFKTHRLSAKPCNRSHMEPKWLLKTKVLLKNAGNSGSRHYEIQTRAFPQCAEVRTVKKCVSWVHHTQRLLTAPTEQLRFRSKSWMFRFCQLISM